MLHAWPWQLEPIEIQTGLHVITAPDPGSTTSVRPSINGTSRLGH